MADDLFKPERRRRRLPIIGAVRRRRLAYALSAILAGAVIFNPLQGGANQQMVGMDQNNTTLEVGLDEILQIELPGNAGTGFKWRFDELDEAFFVLMGSDKQIAEKDNPHYVGNPYLESWTIKAVQTGSSEIRLLYYRPWEGKDMAEKSFAIRVIIK